jgi:DNA mismatch repair ATPase MutS
MLGWLTGGQTDRVIMPVYRFGNKAADFYRLFVCMKEQAFHSSLLQELQADTSGRDGALSGLRSLKALNQACYLSYNPLLHMLLEGFLGWDFWMAFFAGKWAKRYQKRVSAAMERVAEMEELSSLAVLGCVRKVTRPKVYTGEEDCRILCREAFHPLLSPQEVVANSAHLAQGVTVITGSNMSGKTTFLRTLAMNLVLAYTGAGVCAEHFEANYMRIFTSMRVMDDIAGGISTFYAEILRIKGMADYMKQGEDKIPAICLIDEIFKGTNSADRIVGAEKAIQRLSAGKSMVLVSTHDFELCDLTDGQGNAVTNYHFEEYYEDERLLFDYKIKDGRCTTRNAMAILKLAGLGD